MYTIILNYNNYTDTVETIESVLSLEYDANSVLLVENSSDKTDNSKNSNSYPNLAIIENKKNLGYAGGNNVGIPKQLWKAAQITFFY